MTSVLVTGASGFIGSHCLAPLAERGYAVHAVHSSGGSRPVANTTANTTWHAVDLLDVGDVDRLLAAVRPSLLFHLAWYATPGSYVDALENVLWAEASLSLYRSFVEHGGRRMVTSGSSYEYDWRYGYCSEYLTPRNPDTLYGVCKNALGELVGAYSDSSGLSNAWARIFFLYGPRENPNRLVSSVIRSLIADEEAKCSHGEQIRDYLHVQDVANALVALLESEVTGAVNIGSGRPIALKTIVSLVGEQIGRPELIALGAIPPRPNDVPLVVADVRRLRDEVGWQPEIGLDDGLAQTIRWWREETAA